MNSPHLPPLHTQAHPEAPRGCSPLAPPGLGPMRGCVSLGICAGNTQGLVIPPGLCQQEAEAALERDHFPGVKGTWENPYKLRKHPLLPSWSISLDAENISAALFAALLWHFWELLAEGLEMQLQALPGNFGFISHCVCWCSVERGGFT